MADQFRTEGGTVVAGQSQLGDRPCAHLAIDKPSEVQDLFMQARGRFIYSIIVTALARDLDLLARARGGMRFDAAPVP
jgi:hypothetical protein